VENPDTHHPPNPNNTGHRRPVRPRNHSGPGPRLLACSEP